MTEAGTVAGSLTPVAEAAEQTLGGLGVVAAILALVSTANAGILSSSRYPFAMARDGLVPESLAAVSERFGTPSRAITLTGMVLLLLIAFVPILEIAKLASAFQIIVFVLVNLAIVAFREGQTDYAPSFESPLYPWMQAFGAVSGIVLLSQMGAVAMGGAVVIVLGSAAWYLGYARPRVQREGAATDVVRRQVGRDLLAETESAITEDPYEVLVAFTREADREHERSLLRLAADLVRPHGGRVVVVWFEEVPDQTPLERATEVQSPGEVRFEEQTDALAAELDVDVDVGEIVSHDTKRSIVNFARHRGVDTIMAEHEWLRLRSRIVGDPIAWVVRHAPCDVLLVENEGYDDPTVVELSSAGGPYNPETAAVADAIASENDGHVVLEYPETGRGAEQRQRTIDTYQGELADLFSAPVWTDSARSPAPSAAKPELRVRRGADHRLRGAVFDRREGGRDGRTEIAVYAHESRQPSFLRRLFERSLF